MYNKTIIRFGFCSALADNPYLDFDLFWISQKPHPIIVYNGNVIQANRYDIIEKFTAWRVNSTLNFIDKTDMAFIAYRFPHREAISAISVFQWNLTWNALVRQWIFLESHNQSQLGEFKRFVFLWASPVHNEWKSFQIQCQWSYMYFWVISLWLAWVFLITVGTR